MSKLFAAVTNTSNLDSIIVNTAHTAATSTAIINAKNTSLNLGDAIAVDLGYDTDHAQIFSGFVKQVEKRAPDNTYTITAHDVLIRAIDYFIASSNPEEPFSRRNIRAEFLVRDLLELAGLTNYIYDATFFTFAVSSVAEVNLVSSYDYCKNIADLLTWHLFADQSGFVHFENRKPHVMLAGSPESQQPGFVADTPIATITDPQILNITHMISERDLRNRVVVYGSTGIYAEASESSPYLPSGFYKTAVLATPLIDRQNIAQDSADYNLALFNRLTEQVSMGILGNWRYTARNVLTINESILGFNKDMYILIAEHNWSKNGYVVTMDLRR